MIRAPSHTDNGPETKHKTDCMYVATGEIVCSLPVHPARAPAHAPAQTLTPDPSSQGKREGFQSGIGPMMLSTTALSLLASAPRDGFDKVGVNSASISHAKAAIDIPGAPAPVPVLDFDARSIQVNDGAAVATWNNSGSMGPHMQAAAVGKNDVFPTAGRVGQYRHVVFDRTHTQSFVIETPIQMNWLNNSGTYAGMTVFVIAQYYATPANNERLFDFGNGPGSDNVLMCRQGTSSDGYSEVYNQGRTTIRGVVHSLDSKFHMYIINLENSASGCEIKMYIDDPATVVSSLSSPTPIDNRKTTKNYIGQSNWSWDAFLSGNIRRIAMFDHSLSEQETLNVMQSMPFP